MQDNLFQSAMSASAQQSWFTAHCDGGSRGNPGPSGFGAVVEDPQGRIVARLSEFLGIQTNNFAEYSGLLAVLKWAIENDAKCVRVVSDSELMVKQMQGKYSVKSPVLKPLYEEARKLSRSLGAFEIRHTLRAGNKEADQLANEAMDRGMGKSRDQGPGTRDKAGLRAPAARPYGRLETTPLQHLPAAAPKPPRQVLEGYVKDGVVHLLSGELPDGVFVKIVRE
jgi:probable phosphoglycerate mutase